MVGIALVAPAILVILIALVLPFIDAIRASTLNRVTGEFVGLEHYVWLFTEGPFWGSLRRSLLWTVGNLVLQGAAGIGVALLLQWHFRGRDAIRTVILLPFVVPSAVTAITWRWLLNTTYGPLNSWLVDFGVIAGSFNPLNDPLTALGGVVLINTWRWTPLVALVVFAVLQTIPREEYEAARMEGAGYLREFWHVTYPHLSNSLAVLGLLGFLLTFNIFDLVWLLTAGGPADATNTLAVLIYDVAFAMRNIGRGTAISVVLFVLLFAFVIGYFQQEEFKEGGQFE